MCPSVRDPCPVGVDAGPFMSVRTPILTTSSEIWAKAAGDDKIAAANTPNRNSFLAEIALAEITDVLPLPSGALAQWLDPERNSTRPPFCHHSLQSFDGPRQRSRMA